MSKARVTVFVVASIILASLASSPAWALPLGADWQMNEDSGQMMLDSYNNGNNGTPTDVVQGVKEDINKDGVDETTYVFNGSTSRVAVSDAASLDPLTNNIILTAVVKVNGASLDDDSYDVVRKGLVTTKGGDYKMEIKQAADPTVGRLHCFFRGSGGRVSQVLGRDVVDGRWHTLRCEKTSTSVVVTVDGRSVTKTGSAGNIDNASGVMVGAKTVTPEPDDMFDGSMDYVTIDIAQ
jgi:hypothetical protein